MLVKELKEFLIDKPDNLEVMFRRIAPICGNVEHAGKAIVDSYGFFGEDIPCIIIEPMQDEDDSQKDL